MVIIKARKLGLGMQILEILAQRSSWNYAGSTLMFFFHLSGIIQGFIHTNKTKFGLNFI